MITPHIYGHTPQLAKLNALLKTGSFPHAMIFTGPSGIGKRMIAHAFLNTLFCTGEQKPCGVCPACSQITAGSFPDMLTAGPDAQGSFLVGDPDKPEPGTARWIVQRMAMKSVSGKTGVLIDGIDKANDSAQNALLKTLEEPGEGTVLLLTAAERAKVLPTILSRCTELKFSGLSAGELKIIMKDKADNGDLLDFIASASGGSIENAEALADEDMRETILDACREISRAMVSGSALKADSAVLSRPKSGVDGVEILIAIYHHLMQTSAKGVPAASSLYDDIYIDDISALRTIIKMLLAVKKARANNLNAVLQLKALAYYANDNGLPEPPFAPQF